MFFYGVIPVNALSLSYTLVIIDTNGNDLKVLQDSKTVSNHLRSIMFYCFKKW